MAKTKIIAIVASAALVAMLGLSACGSQASSSSSASSSSAASGSASAASSSSASTSASAEEFLVSWKGTLDDGTLVNLIVSDDEKNGGLVLTKDSTAEPKKWLGSMTSAADGTMTITDAMTKDSVSFKLGEIAEDGTVELNVDTYGKGMGVRMGASEWMTLDEFVKLMSKK